MTQNESTSLVTTGKADLCNKNIKMLKTIENQGNNSDYVPHITAADVKFMCICAAKPVKDTPKAKQDGERTAALIRLIFDGCLRVSEALAVRMCDISETPSGWVVAVLGKGHKVGLVAVNVETVNVLGRYAYDYGIAKADLIFSISRSTAFRNIQAAYLKAGLRLPGIERDRCRLCSHFTTFRMFGASGTFRFTPGSSNTVTPQVKCDDAPLSENFNHGRGITQSAGD